MWDELRAAIVRLRDEQPGAITGHPGLRDDDQRPPFAIMLAAWATDVAAGLHRQFGADVALTVGGMAYPTGERTHIPGIAPESAEISAELDGPLTVTSGHHAAPGLLVTNHTTATMHVATNGTITAVVVDPATDRVIGGYSGPQTLALVTYPVTPGHTTRIPLLVGTDSYAADLGYAVPPGDWAIRATIQLGDRTLGTRALPITVTG